MFCKKLSLRRKRRKKKKRRKKRRRRRKKKMLLQTRTIPSPPAQVVLKGDSDKDWILDDIIDAKLINKEEMEKKDMMNESTKDSKKTVEDPVPLREDQCGL